MDLLIQPGRSEVLSSALGYPSHTALVNWYKEYLSMGGPGQLLGLSFQELVQGYLHAVVDQFLDLVFENFRLEYNNIASMVCRRLLNGATQLHFILYILIVVHSIRMWYNHMPN